MNRHPSYADDDNDAAPRGLPLSPFRRVGDTIYVAGQVSRDVNGELVAPGDAGGQAEQVYANLKVVLQAAGAEPRHVVKVTTYLVSPADSPAVTAERQRFFGEHRPPHTGLIVAALGGSEVLVEVEVVAVLPDRS